MPRSVAQLEARIQSITRPGYRGRLLARGLARNLVWVEGKLPEDSKLTNPNLSSDLLSYGLALFQMGLELRELDRANAHLSDAFARAGEAIESVVKNGPPKFNERGFYTVIAASAYHLAHFSARAFSIIPSDSEGLNLSSAEVGLTLLLKRDLVGLRALVFSKSAGAGFDAALAKELEIIGEESTIDHAIAAVLDTLYHQAIAVFDFALESGYSGAVDDAINILNEGTKTASEYGSVPFWWIFTITRHLLDDLWRQSLHVRLPVLPRHPDQERWQRLRQLFIAKLFRNELSEIDLWPSQIAAATRALDTTDDLIAALPTSAGKTRIAEICILRALASETRVVFVTPLRALSAQTEKTLRKTFEPLGFTISSLYGSSGTTGDDADSLGNRNIVVATPEKLDFALRNNAEILDDVGLIIFDEAHTIGAGEREVRYEVLVQRVLRRPDSARRRIVCLSAILPQGDQLDDFVSWIRQDQEGDAISENWRPTRQCFGEITWKPGTAAARLDFRVPDVEDDDAPYVMPFVSAQPPRGKQTKSLPRDRKDLTLMATWRLVEDGQTVLVYSPERRSVMPLAKLALDLVKRGYLESLLDCDPDLLNDAVNIGEEWLGKDHPAVQCLHIGVAVHHGQLPRPFLRAVESLLKERLLKVTIASPTLAQGLNLSATTVLFSSLKRRMGTIEGEEFANVAGRAGRAFVDVEGQVLCAVWEPKHLQQWDKLIVAARERNLKSGLLQLIIDFCTNMAVAKGCTYDQVLNYITGNIDPWKMPEPAANLNKEQQRAYDDFAEQWRRNVSSIDSAILSLVQHDVPVEHLSSAIETGLESSLWERSIARESQNVQSLSIAVLNQRADFIWRRSSPDQRKGYFFSGVGFVTGLALDEYSAELNSLLDTADDCFSGGDIAAAVDATISFAEIVFAIAPFEPDDMLDGWGDVLEAWVKGHNVAESTDASGEDLIEFIEGAFVYRLVWAMEAVRVRRNAVEGEQERGNAGRAALAIETGTPTYEAALLIQNGLASRVAAMKASGECAASFDDVKGLKRWLASDIVKQKEANTNWPTVQTRSLWKAFVKGLKTSRLSRWKITDGVVDARWLDDKPETGEKVRLIYNAKDQNMSIYSPGMEHLGFLPYTWKTEPKGILLAQAMATGQLSVQYTGPVDFFTPGPDDL